MNIKYLRIGNWVTIENAFAWPDLKDTPLQVSGIELRPVINDYPDSKGIVQLIYQNQWKEDYSQFDEFIKPIPLNEDWLLKAGFENHSPGLYRIKIHEHQDRYLETGLPSKSFWDFTIIIEHKYTTDDTEVWIRAVSYLHDLQNLIWSLTGKELEIKQ